MKIALTGATGFIGSHLLPRLLDWDHDVDTHFWANSGKKYDLIIHLAAITHINTTFDGRLFDTNIVMANEIFKNTCRIIYASSCSAAHLTNPYAYSKRYAEYLGERHGSAIGFRFHNVYGPRNNKGVIRFLMSKENGSSITIRGPELVRDYIHVEDVVEKIVKEVRDDILISRVEDVGTGIGTKTMDLVNIYQEISGKKFKITVEEPGINEPKSMISNNIVPHIDLRAGLLKTINT